MKPCRNLNVLANYVSQSLPKAKASPIPLLVIRAIYAHAGNQPGVFFSARVLSMSALHINFAERVEVAVQSSPYLSGRKLRIETEAGRVVLHGTVGTYFQKQMAQEALRRVAGVEAIENRLVVVA
jgi:hypothetical protein